MNAPPLSPASLDRLPPGRTRRVAGRLPLEDGLDSRLIELGFDDGAEVEVLHLGPVGGDPIAVRVDGATVAMRRSLAKAVLLAPVDC